MSRADVLADRLGLAGGWRRAVRAVAREMFVPDVALACPEGGAHYPIDRTARPEQWLDAVYSANAIVTQHDDTSAASLHPGGGLASSSISCPELAVGFLTLLNPQPGDRVLEIGTGTGYTAALLCERIGDAHLTTIEVDAAVAARAAANLKRAGYAPRTVVADGAAGYPDHAPFDRVHVTCAVTSIPHAWIQQTRPGGVIVAPWQPDQSDGQMIRLVVGNDIAHGRFHGCCNYMMLRAQRAEQIWHPHHTAEATQHTTTTNPRDLPHTDPGAQLARTALAPGIGTFTTHSPDGALSLLLYEIGAPHGSWAACDETPTGATITHYGPRNLWDEFLAAHTWWNHANRPTPTRYGLTITPNGEHLWLDTPTQTIRHT